MKFESCCVLESVHADLGILEVGELIQKKHVPIVIMDKVLELSDEVLNVCEGCIFHVSKMSTLEIDKPSVVRFDHLKEDIESLSFDEKSMLSRYLATCNIQNWHDDPDVEPTVEIAKKTTSFDDQNIEIPDNYSSATDLEESVHNSLPEEMASFENQQSNIFDNNASMGEISKSVDQGKMASCGEVDEQSPSDGEDDDREQLSSDGDDDLEFSEEVKADVNIIGQECGVEMSQQGKKSTVPEQKPKGRRKNIKGKPSMYEKGDEGSTDMKGQNRRHRKVSNECQKCGKVFSSRISLTAHIRHKHKALDGANASCECQICEKVFSSRVSLTAHVRRKHQKNYCWCEKCDEMFTSKENLGKHVKKHIEEGDYGNVAVHECHLCGKSCSSLSGLKVHVIRIHVKGKDSKQVLDDNNTCGCDMCNEIFRSQKEGQPICSICNKTFSSRETLNNHKKIHTGDKPHMCDLCGKMFGRVSDLSKHKVKHTEKRTYICKRCGKAFKSGTALMYHERSHTGEKPYGCTECGMTFSQSSNRKRHLARHIAARSGEMPYCCDECGKRFAVKDSLYHHKKYTHAKVRPFKCTECESAFESRHKLMLHNRIHTGEKPYTCELCGFRVRHSGNLKVHMKSVHKQQ